jgi:hypothetical protein
MPIVLEVNWKTPRPPSPMKFNNAWLLEDDFKNLVKSFWKPLEEGVGHSYMHQLSENVGRIRK